MYVTTTLQRVLSLTLAVGVSLLMSSTMVDVDVFSGTKTADDAPPADNPGGVCGLRFAAIEDAPLKESPFAFGKPQMLSDPTEIRSALHEARLCGSDYLGDPALTASHYAAWSKDGLTTETVGPADINVFMQRLIDNSPLWDEVVAEMDALELASVVSIGTVAAGTPSLFMVPNDAGTVDVHQGVTIGDGTTVVFTHSSGAVVELRRECNWQNVEDDFPGVPMLPAGSVESPQPTPTPTPTPNNPTPTPNPTPDDSKKAADSVAPVQGTTPQAAGLREPTAPVAAVVPMTAAAAAQSDTGASVPVQGAAPAPAPAPGAAAPDTDPVVAPAPSAPVVTPIGDPDA